MSALSWLFAVRNGLCSFKMLTFDLDIGSRREEPWYYGDSDIDLFQLHMEHVRDKRNSLHDSCSWGLSSILRWLAIPVFREFFNSAVPPVCRNQIPCGRFLDSVQL